ncbi:MAG: glycosyltransferase family 4 protein [Chloroflexi bacterium]|nr:glycosyltransferase family 4 protein [Chloroflexota bacterium]
MRIALLTLDFPPGVGGVQTYLYEIACRLAKRHELIVVTPVGASPDAEEPFRRVVLPSSTPWAFARSLGALRPDRVLVGHAHPRLLVPAALVARGRYGAIAYGNDYLAAQRRWHRPLFNWLLGRSRPLVTITRANAELLRRLGLPRPVVVYPGTDPTRFRPPPSPPESPFVLLTVGRLVPRKGIDMVLRVLPALLAEFPGLRYRVAGDGPDRPRLERIARDLGVAHAVEFLGRVPDERLPDLYRSAHVFVMPAREEREAASMEGFGIVYLEASASGLPVVAGRSGGAVEAVREGETGLLVPPDDPEALTRTLRDLLGDAALRRRMGQAGRRWVEEEMNWDRAAKGILRALETPS